jgi:hypothetical protein
VCRAATSCHAPELDRDHHAAPAPPYAAVRARRDGPTTGGPCAVPRLAHPQAAHAPRRLGRRAVLPPSDAVLHARWPRGLAVSRSNGQHVLLGVEVGLLVAGRHGGSPISKSIASPSRTTSLPCAVGRQGRRRSELRSQQSPQPHRSPPP